MKLVSIVTGTYNRLAYLQRMVDSVRHSLCLDRAYYEIILVDGGSTDGTIAWALEQPDVSLIQQGELLGAVKAFNAGCRAADGTYVVLANDDIQFLDYSLLAAISYMQDNIERVGVGALYQDRNGRDMHVETMSCVVDGKQVWLPYGQVCIIPRQLGDMVGWWGDYLRTYGGDNELSCNVWETGFAIEPVPCSGITDLQLADGLRQRNYELNAATGESQAWVTKWTRDGLLGPIVKPEPIVKLDVQRQQRIFYAPIIDDPLQNNTRTGLRDALAKRALVVECDYLHTKAEDLVDMACAWDPDVFIFQIHHVTQMQLDVLSALRANHPAAKFVNWNGDYHLDALLMPAYMRLMRQFDIASFVTADIKALYEQAGINWRYWQIGYEQADNTLASDTPQHKVLFLGNGYSIARLELAQRLRKTYAGALGLYGDWPKYMKPDGYNLYDFSAGAKLYKAASVAVGDSQWPTATGYTSNRLFQALAAGAFLLQQRFDGMEEYLGLTDGKHLVTWSTLDELIDKIDYWTAPKRAAARAVVAQAGQQYILEHHSFDARVEELFSELAKC